MDKVICLFCFLTWNSRYHIFYIFLGGKKQDKEKEKEIHVHGNFMAEIKDELVNEYKIPEKFITLQDKLTKKKEKGKMIWVSYLYYYLQSIIALHLRFETNFYLLYKGDDFELCENKLWLFKITLSFYFINIGYFCFWNTRFLN